MSNSELLSNLEVALGGICPAPKILTASRPLELNVSAEIFEKLLRHWAGQSDASRPRLRGLTVSRDVPAHRQLLLDIGARAPFVLITVDSAWAARSLVGIWPYCGWWEEELATFERVASPGGAADRGVSWRRA